MATQRTIDDATLVTRSSQGDGDAFTALYRRHVRAVEHVVAQQTRDREARRDVVQDVFLRALTGLRSLRDPQRFRPWLLTVARHTAIDERRRRGRQRQVSLDDAATAEVAAAEPTPGDVAVTRDMAERVLARAARLKPRDAAVLTLAGRGLEPTEIGAALGVTPNCATVALHRARRRLAAVTPV